MYIANNIEGNRVDISDAKEGEEYFCPICNAKMIQKRGNIKEHHFAHEAQSECDSWNYDMSEWHREWQKRFPVETREVVVSKNSTKHRADILINNTVVEFQHSKMSNEEFNERNSFYKSCGYDVIWLFDLQEYYSDDRIEVSYDSDNKYHWKWAPHTFDDFRPKANRNRINVFFQLSLADEDNYGIEYFAWKNPSPGCRYFCTREDETYNEAYNDTEFIELVTKRNSIKNDNDSFPDLTLIDRISEGIPRKELRSLLSIIENSNSNVIIVRNVNRGIKFKIGISKLKGKPVRGPIMGYMSKGFYDSEFESEKREIYGTERKEWVVDWEK